MWTAVNQLMTPTLDNISVCICFFKVYIEVYMNLGSMIYNALVTCTPFHLKTY